MTQDIEAGKRGRGRPREFDRTDAVDRAMRLFWDRGYEGASLEDLMEAMKLSPSSFYSTFGSKLKLFQEAMDYYAQGPGGFLQEVMAAAPDVRTAFTAVFERGAIESTSEEYPPGCMVALAMVYVGPELYDLRDELRARRSDLVPAFAQHLSAARDRGELPADTAVDALAVFFAACFRGMMLLARDGSSREKLMAIGQMALRALPSAPFSSAG